jgi:hypothetical protein
MISLSNPDIPTLGAYDCWFVLADQRDGRFWASSTGFAYRRYAEHSKWWRVSQFSYRYLGCSPSGGMQRSAAWAFKAEKFMDSSALLSGRSDQYHRTLVKLDKLFLVDVYNYQPLPKGDPKGEHHPPSFAGWFMVFDGNGDVIKKRRKFQARDFHLTPAARCPDAPPAEP